MATTTAMTESRTGYLPSLDGWRALAIVGVLFAHDLPWSIWGFSNGLLLALGGFGVNLFFAISGILITTRILEEERACGAFNIQGILCTAYLSHPASSDGVPRGHWVADAVPRD